MPDEIDDNQPSATDLMQEPTDTQPNNEPGNEPVVPPTTPPAQLSAEDIARIVGSSVAASIPKPTAPTPPPMTKEEAAKMLNVMGIDDDFLAKFDNMETRKAMLERFRDGVVLNADTVAQIRIQQAIEAIEKKYEERFGPLESHFTKAQEEQVKQSFVTKYPGLADPKHEMILTAVANHLKASGATYKTQDEFFTALATGSEKVLKQYDPNFNLAASANVNNKTKPNGARNALPTTTPGGGGGGARGAGGGQGGDSNDPVQRTVNLLRGR